jgi:hypothetical protein
VSYDGGSTWQDFDDMPFVYPNRITWEDDETMVVTTFGSGVWKKRISGILDPPGPGTPPSITTNSLANGTVDSFYSQTLATIGGTTPYSWTVASGALPPGLVLTNTGINGTPVTAGTFGFMVQVSDANGLTAKRVMSITVNTLPRIYTAALPNGMVGNVYCQTLAAAGGSGTYNWTFATGSNPLPTGLTLDGTGAITGTPTIAGNFNITVQATDTNNLTATRTLSITISAAGARTNVAFAENGGVATASSFGSYPPTAVTDGDRRGVNSSGVEWYWRDATYNVWPDWVQVNFTSPKAITEVDSGEFRPWQGTCPYYGPKTITEVDVFTTQDTPATPVEPTQTMTFTKYGITAFDVQYWSGSAWVTLPGGRITGNNHVWRTITFPAVTTDRIRVVVNASLANNSRITEIEAYTGRGGAANQPPIVSLTAPATGATFTAPATINLTATASDPDGTVSKVEFYNGATLLRTATTAPYSYSWTGVAAGAYTLTARAYDNLGATTTSTAATVTVTGAARANLALQANGGVATASTTNNGTTYTPKAVNNGDRKGLNYGAGGTWMDATWNVYPDWVQVTFSGQKTITEVDVFTVQDTTAAPVEPTPTMTFTKYGITAFDVQYWSGSAWVTVPGGRITGNNLVWRKVTFPAVTTDRIRVVVNASLANNSRVAEIEVY